MRYQWEIILIAFAQVASTLCLSAIRGIKPISVSDSGVVSFKVPAGQTTNRCPNPKCPNYVEGVIGY